MGHNHLATGGGGAAVWASPPTRLPSVPLAIWVQHQLEEMRREFPNAREILAWRLGVSERTLINWETEQTCEGFPAFTLPAETVEAALGRIDLLLSDVFPNLSEPPPATRRGYCRQCVEDVDADDRARCLWCDSIVLPMVKDERALVAA